LSPGLGFSLYKSIDGLYITGNIVHGQLCINTTVGANKMPPDNSIDIDTNMVSTFEGKHPLSSYSRTAPLAHAT
jgi:hypothetical protein